jgi:hypothetical protein
MNGVQTNLEPDEDRSCRIGGGGLLVWLSLRLEGCHVILLERSNRGKTWNLLGLAANQSPSPSSSLGDGKATGTRNGGGVKAAQQEHGGRWGYLGAGWDAAARTSTLELQELGKEGWGPKAQEAVPGAYGGGPLAGA